MTMPDWWNGPGWYVKIPILWRWVYICSHWEAKDKNVALKIAKGRTVFWEDIEYLDRPK